MPAGAGAGRFEMPEPPCDVISACAPSGLADGAAPQATSEQAKSDSARDLTTRRLQQPLLAIFIFPSRYHSGVGLVQRRAAASPHHGVDRAVPPNQNRPSAKLW